MRFLPRGSSLFNHTSDASEESLPAGYVFAYSNLNEIFGDWSPYSIGWRRTASQYEVVTFSGREEYQPGDWEGVAVIPTKEIKRETMVDWLKRQARTSDEENIRDSANHALLG